MAKRRSKKKRTETQGNSGSRKEKILESEISGKKPSAIGNDFRDLAIFRMVLASPLLIGAIAVSGLSSGSPLRPLPLFLVIGIFGVLNYTEALSRSVKSLRQIGPRAIGLYIVLIGLFALFSLDQRNLLPSILLFLSGILFVLTYRLELNRSRQVIFLGVCIVELMLILPVLGAVTQTKGIVIPSIAFLGLCPALILAASLFACLAAVFERESWTRRQIIPGSDRGRKQRIRPGALGRLFSLTLVLGAGLPLIVYPLGLLPGSFILVGIPLLFMPTILTEFSEGTTTDDLVAMKSLRLSALMTLIMLFIAIWSA